MNPMGQSHEFIRFAVDSGVLKFGEFQTKAGRISPYFFNAGLFNDGRSLARLAGFYADRLLQAEAEEAQAPFDMLFGPAYKGIALATALSIALAGRGRDVPLGFNRKEAKSHGEGGSLIGAPLRGRVLIVDDVITAGTAVRESLDIIRAADATPCAVVIALDRQERGTDGDLSASEEVSKRFQIPVIAIAGLDELLQFADDRPQLREYKPALLAYRSCYGSRSGRASP